VAVGSTTCLGVGLEGVVATTIEGLDVAVGVAIISFGNGLAAGVLTIFGEVEFGVGVLTGIGTREFCAGVGRISAGDGLEVGVLGAFAGVSTGVGVLTVCFPAGLASGAITFRGVDVGVGALANCVEGAFAVGVLIVFAGGELGVGEATSCACDGVDSGAAAPGEELAWAILADGLGLNVGLGVEPPKRIVTDIVKPRINAPHTAAAISSFNFRFGRGLGGTSGGPLGADTVADNPVHPVDRFLVRKPAFSVSQNS